MDPLIEVVRDTVGRHDTFGLACNAKYYEDRGYPGHVNCSENFNGQVTPFGIAPRMGWEALNFFYNTGFDANNVFVMDEPWSRPATTCSARDERPRLRVVCVPRRHRPGERLADHAGPRAGVRAGQHVLRRDRAARHGRRRSRAHARRPSTRGRASSRRASSSTAATGRRTASTTRVRSPSTGPAARRSRSWISPASQVGDARPGRGDADPAAITRDARRLSVGQVTYTAVCNETGGMIDDATVYRLGQDNFRFVGGDEYDGIWLNELAERLELKVGQAVDRPAPQRRRAGPGEPRALEEDRLDAPTQTSLEDLKWFRFTSGIGTYDGIPIVVSRTGYTGELGYEVCAIPPTAGRVGRDLGGGNEHGLTPLGLEALDILRIESGLIFAGYEFDDQVDPFEAGIGFAVDLRTDDDFVGVRHSRSVPPIRSASWSASNSRAARPPATATRSTSAVSASASSTSGTRSPILKKNIALARVTCSTRSSAPRSRSASSTACRSGFPAAVVRFPFYDPDKTRPRPDRRRSLPSRSNRSSVTAS